MDEGTLGVHEVELVVNARETSAMAADHADGPHHLRQISAGHNCGWLVIDVDLKPVGDPSTN